jgi:hypothetical protein
VTDHQDRSRQRQFSARLTHPQSTPQRAPHPLEPPSEAYKAASFVPSHHLFQLSDASLLPADDIEQLGLLALGVPVQAIDPLGKGSTVRCRVSLEAVHVVTVFAHWEPYPRLHDALLSVQDLIQILAHQVPDIPLPTQIVTARQNLAIPGNVERIGKDVAAPLA